MRERRVIFTIMNVDTAEGFPCEMEIQLRTSAANMSLFDGPIGSGSSIPSNRCLDKLQKEILFFFFILFLSHHDEKSCFHQKNISSQCAGVGGINLNIREGKICFAVLLNSNWQMQKGKMLSFPTWKVCKQLIKISIIIIIKINISTLS